MFYENFERLCQQKGKSMTAVLEELEFSTSNITFWKNGSQPRRSSILTLANYFGVTPAELLADTPPQPKAPTQPKGSPWDSVLSPSALQVALTFDKARPEVQFAIRALLGLPNEETNSKTDLA